jgi:hypothetical protein
MGSQRSFVEAHSGQDISQRESHVEAQGRSAQTDSNRRDPDFRNRVGPILRVSVCRRLLVSGPISGAHTYGVLPLIEGDSGRPQRPYSGKRILK